MNFVKPYLSPNPCIENVTEKNECVSMDLSSDYIAAAPAYLGHDERDNVQSLVFYEVVIVLPYKCLSYALDSDMLVNILFIILFQAESSPKCDRTIYSNEVKVNWSCALCLVSTSSEISLKQHIKGRKHKLKEDEETKHEMIRASKEASKLEGNYLTDLLESFNQFVELGRFNLPIRRPFRFCTWKKPEPGWIKLNTDGSVDRKRAGLGGLLRDYEGVAICACVSEVPCDDIFLVELLAIWRGLTLARSIGIKMIWVESDSMSAVKTINKEQSHSQKAVCCLQHIWKILKKFQKYQVTHSWRETNRAADYLSKMEISRSDIVMWPKDFHSSLRKIIAEDARGSLYIRR